MKKNTLKDDTKCVFISLFINITVQRRDEYGKALLVESPSN